MRTVNFREGNLPAIKVAVVFSFWWVWVEAMEFLLQMLSQLRNEKRAPGCLGCIGDIYIYIYIYTLPSFVGIIIIHDIRILIKQPVFPWKVKFYLSSIHKILAGDLFGMVSSTWPFHSMVIRDQPNDLRSNDQVGSQVESPGWITSYELEL